MKTMTCEQVGGACEVEFHGESLEEIAEQSKKHAMELVENGDEAHQAKMNAMREKMNDPEAMQQWYQDIQAKFDALPEDEQ